MNFISAQREKELISALTDAIHDVNKGAAINESLAKRANEHGFGPEFAARMVEAFNASKTVSHLKSSTAEKRAESFPLADADEVLRYMYSQYSEIPSKKADVLSLCSVKKEHSGSMPKAASIKITPIKSARAQYSRQSQLRDTNRMLKKIARLEHEAAIAERIARDNAVKQAHELAMHFRSTCSEPFDVIEANLIKRHGDLAKRAMDVVWGMADFDRLGEKRASAPAEKISNVVKSASYTLATKCLDAINEAAEAQANLVILRKQAKDATGMLMGKLGTLTCLPKRAATDVPPEGMESVDPGDPSPMSLQKGILEHMQNLTDRSVAAENAIRDLNKKKMLDETGSVIADSIDAGRFFTNSVAPGTMDFIRNPVPDKEPQINVLDPDHEAQIRSIEAKSMVNDMLSNDPVIGSYPPEDVLQAYNQAARLVPTLATEPLVMKGLISRILQTEGRLDPMEAETLLRSETTGRDVRRTL